MNRQSSRLFDTLDFKGWPFFMTKITTKFEGKPQTRRRDFSTQWIKERLGERPIWQEVGSRTITKEQLPKKKETKSCKWEIDTRRNKKKIANTHMKTRVNLRKMQTNIRH